MSSTATSVSIRPRALIAAGFGLIVTLLASLALNAEGAHAQIVKTEALPNGVQRTTYRIGPLDVTPGQNQIAFHPIVGDSRPAVNGWITRIKPDLVEADGTIPKSSKVMFHHGVWMNNTNGDLFYATGEEKTILQLPQGFGYQYKTSDVWVLNDMIHNLTPQPMTLYAEYTLDFIPKSAPEAANIVRSRPIWMDVENGLYPVFDVWRDSGGDDGEFTYPQDAPNAYPPGVQKNVKNIPQNGMLIATTGHVHTGGLSTNLYLNRAGASYQGPTCPERVSYDAQLAPLAAKEKRLKAKVLSLRKKKSKLSRTERKLKRSAKKGMAAAKTKLKKIRAQKKRTSKQLAAIGRQRSANLKKLNQVRALDKKARDADTACRNTQPQVQGDRVHLFDSKAKYFDPKGPVSWDMAMYSTDENWRVRVQKNDKLELQTTYETDIASWPESMGINVVYWVPDSDLPTAANAPNPYSTKVDTEGVLNHGHLSENEDYGGAAIKNAPDPTKLEDGTMYDGTPFTISDYVYNGADFRLPGAAGRPPVVNKGQSFTFKLSDQDISNEVWHSLTSCKTPCNRSTGISYPIPDGKFQFESGQMGPPNKLPTVGYTSWSTPSDLPKGTYTFFCRIHPLMRGAFRVK